MLRRLLFAFLLGAVAYGGARLYDYSFAYYRQIYEPRSALAGVPGYYYLDWRRDWADPSELAPAVVYGPILTPRAVRPDATEHGVDYESESGIAARQNAGLADRDSEHGWLFDPIGLIQAGLSLHDQVLEEESTDPGRPGSSIVLPTGATGGSPDESNVRRGGTSLPQGSQVDPNRLVVLDRRRILLDQVEWLHRSAEWLPDSVAVWSIPWRAGRYDLDPPWISALSQGQAISLLVRTAQWGRPQDLVLAHAAVRSLLDPSLPIVLTDESGICFLDEFPADPPSEVLNGCLLAWLGLWDYVRATEDEELRRTAFGLLDRIEARVPDYELGGLGLDGWTCYDGRLERPTSPGYQELHAALAEAIGVETGREFWKSRAREWRGSAGSPLRRTWVFLLVGLHKVAKGMR